MKDQKTNFWQDAMLALLENKSVASLAAHLTAIYQRLSEKFQSIDEFGMDPVLIEMLRPVFEFLYKEWWRVEVKGAENIPQKGPAIIVANHSGMLPYDAVMINMAIFKEHPKHRNGRFLVDNFVGNFPFLDNFVRRAGGVTASHENAIKLLRKNELVCVFPEGTKGIGKLYSDKYKLQDFGRGGVVKLAKDAGVPVVPCAVVGAEEIHPMIWKSEDIGKKLGLPYFPVTPTFPLFGLVGLIPLPSRWTITFDRPINYKGSKKTVARLNSELRIKVQNMINEELIRRS